MAGNRTSVDLSLPEVVSLARPCPWEMTDGRMARCPRTVEYVVRRWEGGEVVTSRGLCAFHAGDLAHSWLTSAARPPILLLPLVLVDKMAAHECIVCGYTTDLRLDWLLHACPEEARPDGR